MFQRGLFCSPLHPVPVSANLFDLEIHIEVALILLLFFVALGAFELSELVTRHVITAVIPFLPLQEIHVRSCIKYASQRLSIETTEEMISFVLSELDWAPEGTRLFSTSGCKLVYDKIGFYLQMRDNKIDFTDPKNIHGEL